MYCKISTSTHQKIACGFGVTLTTLSATTAAITAIAFFIFSAPSIVVVGGIVATVVLAGGAITAFVKRTQLGRSNEADPTSHVAAPPPILDPLFPLDLEVKAALNQLFEGTRYSIDSIPLLKGDFDKAKVTHSVTKWLDNNNNPSFVFKVTLSQLCNEYGAKKTWVQRNGAENASEKLHGNRYIILTQAPSSKWTWYQKLPGSGLYDVPYFLPYPTFLLDDKAKSLKTTQGITNLKTLLETGTACDVFPAPSRWILQ